MFLQAPSQRHSSSGADETDAAMDTKEAKRVSKPPPGAFVLPAMGAPPKPRKPSTEGRAGPSETESKPAVFVKPALRAVKPREGKDTQPAESPETGTMVVAIICLFCLS